MKNKAKQGRPQPLDDRHTCHNAQRTTHAGITHYVVHRNNENNYTIYNNKSLRGYSFLLL